MGGHVNNDVSMGYIIDIAYNPDVNLLTTRCNPFASIVFLLLFNG